ncbi:MAG: hypothetical protein DRP56_06890 [Planctomycetota bacterium]|nr:MAG: hypothetical protein DRP56_06890 [Planctomycetota bacterium]
MGINDEMLFEQVRDKIEALLLANQGTLFRTIVGQRERVDSAEVKDGLRSLQVFYESGEYSDSKSGKQTKEHDCEYRLEYKLSRAARVDLSVLDNDSATPAQLQAALLAADEGSTLADKAMDEFRRIISQILLDPKNRALGFTVTPGTRGQLNYTVSRPKLERFRKNQPLQKGGLIVLTASETFTTTVTETFDGAGVVAADTSPINYGTGIANADGDPTADESLYDVDTLNSP